MSTTRFQPGTSGNAAGRPANPFAKHRDALAQKLIEAAMQGDGDSLRMAVALAFQTRQMTAKHGGVKV